jgi:hypothetical protein
VFLVNTREPSQKAINRTSAHREYSVKKQALIKAPAEFDQILKVSKA